MGKISNKYILLGLIGILLIFGIYCVTQKNNTTQKPSNEGYSPSNPPPVFGPTPPVDENNMELLYNNDYDATTGSGPGLDGHYRQVGTSVGMGF